MLHPRLCQGCPQALAHSDFAIYSSWLCYLLFPSNSRIIVILIRYALSTHKNNYLALSNLQISLSTLKFLDIPGPCMKSSGCNLVGTAVKVVFFHSASNLPGCLLSRLKIIQLIVQNKQQSCLYSEHFDWSSQCVIPCSVAQAGAYFYVFML